MLTKCPFCNRQHDGQLRCQQCQQRLTEWMNWDTYAQESQAAADTVSTTAGPAAAISCLEHATIFDPDSPHRFAQLGHALLDAEQPDRALVVLQYAQDRFPDSNDIATLAARWSSADADTELVTPED